MRSRHDLAEFKENAKDILVATLIKETQILRSISSSFPDANEKSRVIKKFKTEILNPIRKLRKFIDNETIKNSQIREEIEHLSKKTEVSIGQSQKVINVYLKLYSLILDKPEKVIGELDCPLDSTTMGKKQRMKNIKSMSEYIEWQKEFENNVGIRLYRDHEYDSNRMEKSFEA